MAAFIDNFNINTAVTDNSKLDLGHQHITTANFMQLNPVLCREMVPGERVDVDLMTFSRLQPLAVPTFGRANIKERAFFVPMRTIFRGWNDFITDTPHVFSGGDAKTTSIISQVPVVTNHNLVMSFTVGWTSGDIPYAPSDLTFITPVAGPLPHPGESDLAIVNADGTYSYFKFTSYGRQWLKILESLGYKIVWDLRNEDSYSALPLMAFMKVVMDWYYPTQYVNTQLYADIMGKLNYDGPASGAAYNLGLYHLQLFSCASLYVNYDSDYFVSAWDNPVAPSNGVYSSFSIVDITASSVAPTGMGNASGNWYHPTGTTTSVISNIGVSNVATNGTPTSVMTVTGGSGTVQRLGMSVSDYQHKALTALTDYMKRHQLVGSRAVDRYLARFGKTLNNEKANRCNYISSKMVPLQVSDVTSTSNTPTYEQSVVTGVSGLGSFAGKGMAYEPSFKFDWSTNEYGYLFVLSSIVPSSGLWQGLERKVMHKTKLDFWTPEFDGLSVQAISTRELYNGLLDTPDLSNQSNGYMAFDKSVFGFAPRYGEYKYVNDKLTGDFVVDSLNMDSANKSAWHLMRTFDKETFKDDNGNYDYSNLVHSRKFVSGLYDHYQFNRIFNYYAEDPNRQPDPFTLIYNFNMVSYAPMKALYETYEFEDEGRTVSTEVGGVKAN